jgi:hypothetical protein
MGQKIERVQIPKIIHYCWFGNGIKNKTIKNCMKSWGKHLKGYATMAWTEDTFDFSKAPVYVREAMEAKKWAFVSDYVRLWALYNYGGVYVDTDIEILKSLDKFLLLEGFSGFTEVVKDDFQIPAAVMGSTKGNKYIKFLLSYYSKRHFKAKDGKLDMKANVFTITEMTCDKYPKFKLDNSLQKISNYVYYPHDVFTPSFKHHNRQPIITDNTYAIHYHNESWMPFLTRLWIRILIVFSHLGLREPLRKVYGRIFRKK